MTAVIKVVGADNIDRGSSVFIGSEDFDIMLHGLFVRECLCKHLK